MYQSAVTTQPEAISHLFFHCCFIDGRFTEDEIKIASDKLVAAGLHKELHIKDEVVKYKGYRSEITDEDAYLQYLLQLIRPTNEMALYSYCVELCLGDGELSTSEETVLQKLGSLLQIEEGEQSAIKRLMVQRKIIESQKLF